MAFRFRLKDADVEGAVRRIAAEQIGKAIAGIDRLDASDAVGDRTATGAVVHDVRKRCKKLRGLIRLVRPAFPHYAHENAAFRDCAQAISGTRDTAVMIATYDALASHFRDQIDRRALGAIRRPFTLRHKAEREGEVAQAGLAQARTALLEAQERAAHWRVEGDGWETLSPGFRQVYARARKAAESVAGSGADDETVHDLRKRIKYHWYHCRMLAELWPEMMAVRDTVARGLSDTLGLHHDLSVFREKLSDSPLDFGNPRSVHSAIALAGAMQRELEHRAREDIEHLLSQSPKALDDQCAALWDAWRCSR